MSYVFRTPIRFGHVDAAGIVFYPRYFEFLNAAFEDWFADVVGVDFATLHLVRKIATPMVSVQADFEHPGRLGEMLDITLSVERVGSSSCTIAAVFAVDGICRLRARLTSVCMDMVTSRAMPWPEDLRAPMERALVT